MPFLDRDSVKVYYETHGQGRPVILTHGYSATSQMWQGQIQAFTEAGYKLIIWDMRGHGQTSYPEEMSQYTEEHTVADMLAIINHVCGTKAQATVGGLSLGGYMSLAFYRLHPERVNTLLIIDTGPGFRSDKARDGWNQYALKTAENLEKNGLAVITGESPERRLATHRDATGLVRAARGMLSQRNSAVIDSLPNIRVPTLLVVGEDDKPFLAGFAYMHKKIPGSKQVTIPRAGHAANIDQPEEFNQAVVTYLQGVNGKSRL